MFLPPLYRTLTWFTLLTLSVHAPVGTVVILSVDLSSVNRSVDLSIDLSTLDLSNCLVSNPRLKYLST